MLLKKKTNEDVNREAIARDDVIHWYMQPVPPMKDLEVSLDEQGSATLGTQTFTRGEEINGHEFGGSFVAWRPVGRWQTISFEFEGQRRTIEFDLHWLCGWRCFGIEPILVIKNTETGSNWLFVCQQGGGRAWTWYRVTPTRGGPPAWQAGAQLGRLLGLVFIGAMMAPFYLLPASFCLAVLKWVLGH